jgi:hypothetical protein
MNVKIILITVFVLLFPLSGCSNSPTTQVPTNNSNLQFSVVQEGQILESIGEPYPIEVDNCDGARDSEKIEERSRSFITELSLEVSETVAAEVGGNIEVAKIMISDEIGVALGVRIGTSIETRSSIKIVTPAGYRTIAHLQWREVWSSGKVAISHPDGTYIDVLPYSVLNSLTLEQLDSKTVECKTGSIVEAGPTAQISTPEVPVILPTSAPVSIGSISVVGNSSVGTKFTADQAGVYIFKYVSGSYSTYPESKTPPAGTLTWLTAIRMFKNRPIEWNGEAISEQNDYRIVDFGFFSSAAESEEKANGGSLTVTLLKGDYLLLAPVDEQSHYSDNPGEVIFDVLYTDE